MIVDNYYPEVPEVPYEKTAIALKTAQDYINQTGYTAAVKAAAFTMFRKESSGRNGVNNNYTGAQADKGRWPKYWDAHVVATTVKGPRRFIVWDTWQTSFDHLLARVADRGLFIGGFAHPHANFTVDTAANLQRAYFKEWVVGESYAEPPTNEFLDIYNSVASLFSNGAKKKGLQFINMDYWNRIGSSIGNATHFFIYGEQKN